MEIVIVIPVCGAVVEKLKKCFRDQLPDKTKALLFAVYGKRPSVVVSVDDTVCDEETIANVLYCPTMIQQVSYYDTEKVQWDQTDIPEWLRVQWVKVFFHFDGSVYMEACLLQDYLEDLLSSIVLKEIGFVDMGTREQVLVVWVTFPLGLLFWGNNTVCRVTAM